MLDSFKIFKLMPLTFVIGLSSNLIFGVYVLLKVLSGSELAYTVLFITVRSLSKNL
ncbi:hypothetical protein DFM90_002981 [Clostridium beijerinckii]|uniref:hypothetical protein n=1 Tax=Clostridium beijerinckii TaxID=1520 RepID=UPI001F4C4C8E|nr:hypothetical protein [Clostridium beijerinckii]NRX21944.1 hypothetical protein [Clostridium beijerinckii]